MPIAFSVSVVRSRGGAYPCPLCLAERIAFEFLLSRFPEDFDHRPVHDPLLGPSAVDISTNPPMLNPVPRHIAQADVVSL
jgi:hypothetical protein